MFHLRRRRKHDKEQLCMAVATLQNDLLKEWRLYWASRMQLIIDHGFYVDVQNHRATITRGEEVYTFTHEDSPAAADEKLITILSSEDKKMLVLSRHIGESLIIADNIEVKVLDIRGNQVKIGIAAPEDVHIVREELIGREQKRYER